MASGPADALPTGTVTFLFTDVEGSTKLMRQAPDVYQRAIARHHEILASSVVRAGGRVFETVGDAVYAAFSRVEGAATAAADAQRALAAEHWGETPIHVRMAIHSGDVDVRGEHYFGPALYRAARLMSVGHGEQVLVSAASAAMLRDRAARGLDLIDLGEHRLKDMPGPERVYQLTAPGLRRDHPPLRSLAGRRHDLPLLANRLIGRQRELDEGRRILLSGVRLLTLTGVGGVGKTRLAVELAGEISDEFADGTYFVPLARISDPMLVTNAIAQAIGVRDVPGRPLVETLIDHVRPLRLLLLLDNFEHVLAGAGVVSDLLADAPELHILATSQAPLRIQAEQELSLQPLSRPTTAGGAPEIGPAVILFLERAQQVRPQLRPGPADLRSISEICDRLDGLPLAIELAAARTRLLTPTQLLGHLDRSLPILTGGARDLPDRQRTMRRAIEWSHDLLEERDRVVFRRCAVLNGPCDVGDAEAILASGGDLDGSAALDALGSLAEKSLLRQTDGRVSMLAVIREYATERLHAAGERDAWGRTHAEHFRRTAAELDELLRGREQLGALSQMDAALDQLRGALAWASERDKDLGVSLCAELSWYWFMRGHQTEALHWYRSLLPIDGVATGQEGSVLAWASYVHMDKGDHEAALALMREAEDRAPHVTNAQDRVLCEIWCAYARILDDPRAALTTARRVTAERLGIHGHWSDGWLLLLLGELERFHGNDEAALAAYERSIDAFQAAGDRFSTAMNLINVTHLYLRRGQIDAADQAVREGLAQSRIFGSTWTFAYAAIALAGVAVARGDMLAAVRLLAAANAWFEQNRIELQTQDRPEYERYFAVARSAVGEAQFAAAWSEGSHTAVDDALEGVERSAWDARSAR